jgi:hypothetical protein
MPPLADASHFGLRPIPQPVILALLYAGAMSLFLLWLELAYPMAARASIVPTTAWLRSGGADAFRHSYRTVHLLLIGYLWVSARGGTGGGGTAGRWAHAGAAVLVGAVHWALDAALRGMPVVGWTRWFPG